MRNEELKGQLVKVSMPDGSGGVHVVYGRLTGHCMMSITALSNGERTVTVEAGSSHFDPDLRQPEPWFVVQSETGGNLAQVASSLGKYGSQAQDSPFRRTTENWSLGQDRLRVRDAYDGVRVEPIDDEGREWIEENMTVQAREDRLRAKLAALDPKLEAEFLDVVWRARDEGRRGLDRGYF